VDAAPQQVDPRHPHRGKLPPPKAGERENEHDETAGTGRAREIVDLGGP
jgi:hypothetical protein